MTAQKLLETLTFLTELDTQLRLQNTLETIREALNNLTSSPANTGFQSTLGSNLDTLKTAVRSLQSAINPSQAAAIAEIGGEEFFAPSIADTIQEKVSANAMTPQVARDFVQDFVSRRDSFLQNVRTMIGGMKKLNIQAATTSTGAADVAFLIPREIFENDLGQFAKELSFIHRLVQHISEATTGEAGAVPLQSLSSSVPTISLESASHVVSILAQIVNLFLTAWERVTKLRKIREELVDIGMKGKAVDELTDQVETVIEETVETSTTIVFSSADGAPRSNELRSAVRTDVRRLYGQIERGLTVEFHANPEGASEDQKEALQTVLDLSRTMKFPAAAPQPLLLKPGQVIEGEIYQKVTKTTTTKKSTKTPADS